MTGQESTANPVQVIADYRIVRVLGEGNNGRFYLAIPPERLRIAEQYVALKVFSGPSGEDAYRRGVRELRALAAVKSTYLAVVYDAVLADQFLYAMRYFPMGSLAHPARPIDRNQSIRALEHAARAAHDLHQAGIVHGDLKPANVMLLEGGGAQVSDLGLSRAINSATAVTGMGSASSLEYSDPGLLVGDTPSRATDIWALGATVHRVLAGVGLFGELPVQPLMAIRQIQSAPAQIHPSLGPEIAELVRRCIAPVGQRPATAAEVAEILANAVQG